MAATSVELRCGSSLKLELSTTMEICKLVNSPRALTVFLMCKYEEFDQLVSLTTDPSRYEDPEHFARDYLVSEILRKSPLLPTTFDREAEAIASFFEAEQQCVYVNDRLWSGNNPNWVSDLQREVYNILGPLTRRDLNNVERHFRFGPGATTGVRGTGSVMSDKIDAEMHLTDKLVPFVKQIMGELWWQHQSKFVVVKGNKFATVPKTAKTDRGICVEPTLNSFAQLGVGSVIRDKLKRFGVDLNDQTKNQNLAQRAWKDGLATIDLSAASDSVSASLVHTILPYAWFELLDLFRCDFSYVKGMWVELEKFSSMGNGYTFELESLIFYALCRMCVPIHDHGKISVYGDDIIVPREYAGLLIERLEFLGFKVNRSKSFLAGNFFESCGADFFKGINVRPFYLKGNGDIPYSVQIANRLRLYAHRRNNFVGCDALWLPLWKALRKTAPKEWRKTCVPPSFGDLGFIVDETEARHLPKPKHGWDGRLANIAMYQPVKRRKTSFGRLLLAYSQQRPSGLLMHRYDDVPDSFTMGFEPVRGWLGKLKTKRVPVIWDTIGLYWA